MLKTIVQNKTEMEQLKNDPFIARWRNNYTLNLQSGIFSDERSRPLMYIMNTQPYRSPVIVLAAAGPSLDKNISILKKYRNNFLLFCADIVLFRFVQEGIIPDFVVNIDPQEEISNHWRGIDTSKSVLICPTSTSPHTINTWQGRILFFNQTDILGTPKGEALKQIISPTQNFGNIFNRFFVGATMLQASLYFQPSKLILIGYDFAYTDDKAYCDGLLDFKVDHTLLTKGTPEYDGFIEQLKQLIIKKEQKVVIDNQEIWTSKLFIFYKQVFLDLIFKYRLSVINATEGGILREIDCMSLESALQQYCVNQIEKVDIFALPKRKRGRRR